MSIASNLTSGPYVGNGSQTAFAFTFTVAAASELRVQVNGVDQSSSLYTVALNADGTGTLTFSTAPANGATVLLVSNPSFAQETLLESEGEYTLDTINAINRRDAVRTNWLAQVVAKLLPSGWETFSNRAGKFLGWDASGNPVTLTGTGADSALRTDLAASGGSALAGFLQAGTGTTARTVQAKLRDLVATPDFTTHAAADAAGIELYVPTNITSTRATGASVVANQWGPGRVTTADGNKRGKWFSNVTAAPSSLGNHDSIETAFNGDLSHSIFQIEHRITGAASLSQPTTGYVYRPEAYPFYGVLYNSSGHNQSTTGNDGRTAACFSRVSVKHYGQGDAVCYNASAFVNSTKVGATSFLAQPAAVLFNGDVTAGANYVYLNPREVYLDGVTYDVAAIGDVINMERNVATGAQDCWWGGVRIQSIGSAAINCLMSATGKANAGIDLSMSALDFGANKAAVSLKTGDRVYFNNSSSNGNYTTTFNGDYIEHSSGVGGLNFVVGGSSIFQITTDRLTMNKPPRLPTVTVAGLPAASTRSGMEYYVSDANATTRLSTVAGGGANFVKVFSNGTNWLIA